VAACFSCLKRSLGDTVFFLVDTGSTSSFLSEVDTKRFGLDYSTLKQLPKTEWVTGIGGVLPLYQIADECKLTFGVVQSQNKILTHVKTLDHFNVVKVEISDAVVKDRIMKAIPSILGMDILREFKFVTTNTEAYLEA
jgi:predicted aspartyl protease